MLPHRLETPKKMDRKQLPSINDIDHIRILTQSKEIQIASGDLEDHVRDNEKMALAKSSTYYQDIIYALMHIKLPENDAKRDWMEILRHKYMMSEKLGRNAGIHVATLDYYTNIKKCFANPTIVDVDTFMDTASLAITDELTHAYNRRFFLSELHRLCTNPCPRFSLLMIDIDYFKSYNDTNGHIKGDIALVQIVNIFNAVCGNIATVCRYGGEEFCILLSVHDREKVLEIAEQVRTAVYDFRFLNEHLLPNKRLSVSGGISLYHEDITSPWDLVQEADTALYQAKNNGRNKIELYTKESVHAL